MYFWKCWRDTRLTFFVLLGAVCIPGALALAVLYNVAGWQSALGSAALARETAATFLRIPSVFLLLAGLLLGSDSLGEEYAKGTLPFLLTRPVERRALFATNWAVGAAEVAVLALALQAIKAAAPVLPAYPQGVVGAMTFESVVIAVLAPLLIYSLTYFTTMLFRSGRQAIAAVLVLVISYYMIAAWVFVAYNFYLPFTPATKPRIYRDVPWLEVSTWLAATLVFIWPSRMLLRREV